ncbi:MAG: ribonuclease HII [Clostridia bacterium]|nr:ribonuclease HII [Clostridia bacterium]
MPRTDRNRRMLDLKAFDAQYAADGLIVAGMDEAGRGPLVGPVVAACAVMKPDSALLWVDDSKKLSEKRRELLYDEIRADALQWAVGMASAEEIDRLNILNATKLAMRRAAEQISADIWLIDAVKGLGLPGREVPIIKGDASSYAIAAASILAKVTRDRLLRDLDERYPGYGFLRNKGYGTAEHIAALRELGPCPEHRRSFIGHFVKA